ncbi:MAG TPA: PH domain-containing protein [Saprospiraceae bacterium]|nr:PH domain-containing protein [Saprospiraceae bacterium]
MNESQPNELFSNAQVDLSGLPQVDKLEVIRLEPTYKMVRYIQSALVGMGIITLAFFVVMFAPNFRNIPLFLSIIALCIWNIIYHGISFQYMGYAIREKDITYQSGWLWKSMTTVPFNRVQHCDIKQGLLDRQFGLARLTIYTAGGQHTEVLIPGLLPDTAEKLKTFILHSTEQSIETEPQDG